MQEINYIDIKVSAARFALFNSIKDVIEEINIHSVIKLKSGENLPTHKMIEGNYPVFGGGGNTKLTHKNFNVDFDTLAIGRVGARCGCVFRVPKQSWVTDNALYANSIDERFEINYLIHYLNYVDLNQYANRAAQPVISLKRISSITIPLVDREKQIAFVKIIDDVENGKINFGEDYYELNNALKSVNNISKLQTELSHQLTLLSNLNQAILQEAVQGKLVPQDENDEPASELLERIKMIRLGIQPDPTNNIGLKPNDSAINRAGFKPRPNKPRPMGSQSIEHKPLDESHPIKTHEQDKAEQLNWFQPDPTNNIGLKPTDSAINRAGFKPRPIKELPPIKPEDLPAGKAGIPFEIPENWVWCRLGEIAESTSGGTPDRSNPKYWNGNISWLKSGELTDDFIENESEEKITDEGFKNSSAKLFPKGTLLIALYGATAGKLGILKYESTTNQAVCGFFENEFYDTKYLFYFLWAFRGKIIEDSWGQAQPNISQTYLKNLPLAFPPLSEQKRIVAAIEKQFALTQQLKEKVLANQQATEQLLKALLHQAFEVREVKEVNS